MTEERKTTNFETIEETKEVMQETAKRMLDNLGEIYQVVKNIAEGKDPEQELKFKRVYKYCEKEDWPINIVGLTERTENDLAVLIEFGEDLNTLRGRGQVETAKNTEYFSEDLNDYR